MACVSTTIVFEEGQVLRIVPSHAYIDTQNIPIYMQILATQRDIIFPAIPVFRTDVLQNK